MASDARVTFEWQTHRDAESDPEDVDYTFFFHIKASGIDIEVRCGDPAVVTRSNWTAFARALRENGSARLAFCNIDGNVGIDTDKGFTTYSISKMYSYSGGYIDVKVPNDVCFQAMEEAVKVAETEKEFDPS